MDFFRNPEIKRNMLLYGILTVVVACIGFIIGMQCGIFVVCVCLAFHVIHFISTYSRYRNIAGLSLQIDKILHGNESLDLGQFAEGELAVLQSEIYKMTVRMREQADALQNDKVYLANSIADISHQIRTPLTSINLIVSFLSKPELDIKRRMELTKELVRLLSRIDWLISSLLKMSKLDAGTANLIVETVSVDNLIQKAVEPFEIAMELHEQQLNIVSNGTETFKGDLSWTVEAVGNIIKNCLEHTPNGGMIEIIASENPIYTEIVIKDNGSGIDKNDLPHLFERFYKGKNAGSQSVGIGLALTRMIVIAQNGTIKVENNKNVGAKFSIRFYKETV